MRKKNPPGCRCGCPTAAPYDCAGYSFCSRGITSEEMEATATVAVAHTGLGGNNGIILSPAHRDEYNPIQGKTFRYLYWESSLDYVGIVNGEAAYRKIVVLGANCRLGTDIQYYRADGSRFALGGCNNTFVGSWECFDANNLPSPTGCHARRTQQDTNCVVATTHVYLGDCGQTSPYDAGTNADQPAMMMAPMAARSVAAAAPSPRLRVGLVTPWLCAGGAEDWQLTLIDSTRALLGDAIEWVGAAAINSDRVEPAMVAALESRMPVAWGWEAGFELAGRCDVLVSWHVANYAQWFEALESPPKVLWVNHTPNAWRADATPLFATCDRIVAVSDSARDAYPPELRGRVAVIPNAIDPGRLAPTRSRAEVRASWGVGPGDRVVLQLGRLDPEKNPRAATDLAAAAPDLRVVLVGNGTLRAEVEAAAPPNCRVAGADMDKGSVLHAADALLVPSRYESFGLALLEAWAVGLPVVAGPVGLAELHPGFVRPIPAGADGPTIAGAVAADLADPAGTRRRAAAARAFAASEFGPVRFARAYAAELAELAPPAAAASIRSLLGPGASATRIDLPAPAVPGPSLMRKAASFGRAVVAQVAAGNPATPPDVLAERERACRACVPYFDPDRDECRMCGCNLAIKRGWATSACPDGRW